MVRIKEIKLTKKNWVVNESSSEEKYQTEIEENDINLRLAYIEFFNKNKELMMFKYYIIDNKIYIYSDTKENLTVKIRE